MSAVTAVSHPTGSEGSKITAFFCLARWSLGMVPLMLASGCIVADPPVFQDPDKTPPFLDLSTADPETTRILKKQLGENVPFSVMVRSEDNGDPLYAVLWLNYQTVAQEFAVATPVAPSSFDQERKIELNWTVRRAASSTSNCQQLTLVVTHFSNIASNRPKDQSDAAMVTWWVEIESSDGSPMLESCDVRSGS